MNHRINRAIAGFRDNGKFKIRLAAHYTKGYLAVMPTKMIWDLGIKGLHNMPTNIHIFVWAEEKGVTSVEVKKYRGLRLRLYEP